MPRKERNSRDHSVWGMTTDRVEIQPVWRTAVAFVYNLKCFHAD